MSLLVEDWVSRASALQRRGRAGRVRPGRCFGLYTRNRFEHRMRKYQACSTCSHTHLYIQKHCICQGVTYRRPRYIPCVDLSEHFFANGVAEVLAHYYFKGVQLNVGTKLSSGRLDEWCGCDAGAGDGARTTRGTSAADPPAGPRAGCRISLQGGATFNPSYLNGSCREHWQAAKLQLMVQHMAAMKATRADLRNRKLCCM